MGLSVVLKSLKCCQADFVKPALDFECSHTVSRASLFASFVVRTLEMLKKKSPRAPILPTFLL